MSEALAEVEWIRGIFGEMTDPKFSIIEWRSRTRHRGLLVAARTVDPSRELPKVLTICDAKSLHVTLPGAYTGLSRRVEDHPSCAVRASSDECEIDQAALSMRSIRRPKKGGVRSMR